MMADLRMLQEQSQQLQNLLGALNESLKATNARIDARLDEQTNVTRKAFADQKLVIDNLSNDLRVVREKLDDNNVRIGSLTQEVDALRQAVQQLGSAPRRRLRPDAAGAGTVLAGGVPGPRRRRPLTPSARRPNGRGTARTPTTRRASGTSAILGFEAYVKSFPKSDKADDAQVNIGNAYLNDAKPDRQSRRSVRQGDPQLPERQRDSRGVLQEGARVAEPRPARSRARGVRLRGQDLPRQRRRTSRKAAPRSA